MLCTEDDLTEVKLDLSNQHHQNLECGLDGGRKGTIQRHSRTAYVNNVFFESRSNHLCLMCAWSNKRREKWAEPKTYHCYQHFQCKTQMQIFNDSWILLSCQCCAWCKQTASNKTKHILSELYNLLAVSQMRVAKLEQSFFFLSSSFTMTNWQFTKSFHVILPYSAAYNDCWSAIPTYAVGWFCEAGLHEWMPFVIFCTRSCERS